MNETKPKRRWLIFSLRSLFVVVSFICFWLGFNFVQVRQRQIVWQRIEAKGGIVAATYPGDITGIMLPNMIHVTPRKPLSWTRSVLGDLPVMAILLPAEESASEQKHKIKDLFPEAMLVPYDKWKGRPQQESVAELHE